MFATDLTALRINSFIHSVISTRKHPANRLSGWVDHHLHLAHYGPHNFFGVTGSSGHLKSFWISRGSSTGSQVAPIMAVRRSPPLKLGQ